MAHGLRIRRPDGTIQLSTEDGITTFRHLQLETFDEYQVETTVPASEFDETRGVLQAVYHAQLTVNDDGFKGYVAPNVFDVPSLLHANGQLTYTPPSTSNNQLGDEQQVTINLYHYS